MRQSARQNDLIRGFQFTERPPFHVLNDTAFFFRPMLGGQTFVFNMPDDKGFLKQVGHAVHLQHLFAVPDSGTNSNIVLARLFAGFPCRRVQHSFSLFHASAKRRPFTGDVCRLAASDGRVVERHEQQAFAGVEEKKANGQAVWQLHVISNPIGRQTMAHPLSFSQLEVSYPGDAVDSASNPPSVLNKRWAQHDLVGHGLDQRKPR